MSSGLSLAFMVIGLLAVVFALVVVWRRTPNATRAPLSQTADSSHLDSASRDRAAAEAEHIRTRAQTEATGILERARQEAEQAAQGRREVEEEIRAAVDALDPEQEAATARQLVERKLASTRGRPPEARARQAAGMLARKGYPPGLAFRLIREAMQREGAELDELDADQYLDPDAEDDARARDDL